MRWMYTETISIDCPMVEPVRSDSINLFILAGYQNYAAIYCQLGLTGLDVYVLYNE